MLSSRFIRGNLSKWESKEKISQIPYRCIVKRWWASTKSSSCFNVSSRAGKHRSSRAPLTSKSHSPRICEWIRLFFPTFALFHQDWMISATVNAVVLNLSFSWLGPPCFKFPACLNFDGDGLEFEDAFSQFFEFNPNQLQSIRKRIDSSK